MRVGQEAPRTPHPAQKKRLCFFRDAFEKKAGGALLSRALERSIIAAGALNGRVRDGNGCRRPARATSQREWTTAQRLGSTRHSVGRTEPHFHTAPLPRPGCARFGKGDGGEASRPIRNGRLRPSRAFDPRPVNPVVCRGPSGPCGLGRIISGGAWRLDAFSAYPAATWLPGGARRPDSRNTRGRPPPVLSY